MDTKKIWQSKTINASAIGAVVSFIVVVLSGFGIVNVSPEEQELIAQNGFTIFASLGTLCTSIIAIYGRIKADHKIEL